MLLQKGAEDFSNVAGLQHIEFEKDSIETTFWEIQRVLETGGPDTMNVARGAA